LYPQREQKKSQQMTIGLIDPSRLSIHHAYRSITLIDPSRLSVHHSAFRSVLPLIASRKQSTELQMHDGALKQKVLLDH
jgi:hypothetical protein